MEDISNNILKEVLKEQFNTEENNFNNTFERDPFKNIQQDDNSEWTDLGDGADGDLDLNDEGESNWGGHGDF